MKFISSRYRRYFVFGLVTVGFVLLLHQVGEAISDLTTTSYASSPQLWQTELLSSQQSIEEPGRKCLPENASNAEYIGQYQDTQALFTIWNFDIGGQPVLRINSLFSGDVCGLAFDSRYNQFFSDDMSQNLSRQLALVFYSEKIEEAGGVDAYQRSIDEELQESLQSGEPRYFSDEYIWALSELGINFPEGSYEIFDPNNPPTPQGPNTGT